MGRTPRLFRRTSVMDALDGMFLAFSAVAAGWFAYLLLVDGVRPGQTLLLVVFWVFVAYLLLPRLHRIFTHIYLPDYFIGQARTSDGRIGDPVNLAWRGREAQLHKVMSTAEWVRADDLDFRAGRRIVTSTLSRRSYPEAPVSPLVLFDRQQDFAYEREVAGSPSRRHHVRFWRCPEGWMLPGGFAVDWLAAATYDRRVGLSTFTLQVTHKIDAHVDVERDFVVSSVTRAVPAVDVSVIDHFSSGYHSRNGGGDVVETDGDLPVVDVSRVEVVDQDLPTHTDSRRRLPAPTVFGAGVAAARSISYVVLFVLLLVSPASVSAGLDLLGTDIATRDVRGVVLPVSTVLAVSGLVDLALAVGVLRGSNTARLLLMSICVVVTIVTSLGSDGRPDQFALTHLPTVGVNILVILALSSHRARDYATHARQPTVTTRTRLPA
ncbi:LssY C-terminal domain-containing protein [Mumia sp. zg.B21]|uniref:LssY C-terminal domain-containing protein n=1 Tax=Mumia sp. zg.B21 TaxID=2855447 RepID=UPI001C6EC655|nr:LssY C-terminal domain-containing protein [Mumia sp. zg.B21]MBW9211042.1 LssY C-terminal domain-containing protein [Mumia sp. zg.B21]